jgi:hypothetical protein
MATSSYRIHFNLIIILIISFFIFGLNVYGQEEENVIVEDSVLMFEPAPPSMVTATDHKYDTGEIVDIRWELSVDDSLIHGYEIFRSEVGTDEYISIGFVPAGERSFTDNGAEKGTGYVYRVDVVCLDCIPSSGESDIIIPDSEMINWNLLNLFVIGLLIAGSVIFFIARAQRGKRLFIRKIAGLEAIDEAVGRATEMGRPILFIPGINDMDDVQTIAGITILGRVAKIVADYDIKINMPVSRSIVMTVARETIKEAYLGAGRPDAYNDDMVRYVTDEQFGYVAAVDGIMVRDKPATCFYLGAFFAESLILAETGNSIGAIQIAGTAMPAQLPFFVAACDYTLIGEELFAASAYLSNEPKQLGSIKGQDVAKFIAMVAILIGAFAATLADAWGIEYFIWLEDFMRGLFTIIN